MKVLEGVSSDTCLISAVPHRYVKSKSEKQLLYGLEHKRIGSCQPEVYSNGLPIVPCGLIAWSLFNDSYTFVRETVEMAVNRKNIAWQSDRDHKYGKNVYPFNFQNGTLIGGRTLDPSIPVSIPTLQYDAICELTLLHNDNCRVCFLSYCFELPCP